jgi:hypothetical protein
MIVLNCFLPADPDSPDANFGCSILWRKAAVNKCRRLGQPGCRLSTRLAARLGHQQRTEGELIRNESDPRPSFRPNVSTISQARPPEAISRNAVWPGLALSHVVRFALLNRISSESDSAALAPFLAGQRLFLDSRPYRLSQSCLNRRAGTANVQARQAPRPEDQETRCRRTAPEA